MDAQTMEAERLLDEAFDNVVVLEPPSYPEDDLITPGEFDIA
jgi:hypothetical protein